MKDFYRFGRKIIAVARNYPQHAVELQNPMPTSPIFFLKPTTSYVKEPAPILIPTNIGRIDFEVELGVTIGRSGRNIRQDLAESYIDGYCLAIDVTARDLQNEAMQKGLPWTVAKGQDCFCPVSDFVPRSSFSLAEIYEQTIWLKKNGQMMQKTKLSEMFFKVDYLISEISKSMRLEEGDLLLTGTPAGVGPFGIGDILTAGMGHDFLTMKYRVLEKPVTNVSLSPFSG